jgi:hypothetical protein
VSDGCDDAFDIVIIAGQSNAVGYGLGPYSVDRRSDDKLFQVGRIGTDNLRIISARKSLQFWGMTSTDWTRGGIGLSFIREFAKAQVPGRKVLVIPAAKSGTSILQWQPGGKLYSDMIQRIQRALQTDSRSRIAAVLWHQSETDISHPMAPESYFRQLKMVFVQLRNDFPGSFPILVGEPVPSWKAGSTQKTAIVDQIKKLSQDLPEVSFVSAAGLLSNQDAGYTADPIHFSGAAAIEYGLRYYFAYSQKLHIAESSLPGS